MSDVHDPLRPGTGAARRPAGSAGRVDRPEGPGGRRIVVGREHAWPIGITLALVIVVLVNLAFIYIAVAGADEVAPSYVEGER